MRRGTWQRLFVAVVLGVATVALAEAPPAAQPAPTPAPARASADAAAWDDSHMQSRYQPVQPSNRTRIEGETGYGLLARGGAEARKQVEPELEFTSQRQWAQGSLSSSSSAGAAGSPRSGATSGVHRSGRSGTPSSALRAGSVHSSN